MISTPSEFVQWARSLVAYLNAIAPQREFDLVAPMFAHWFPDSQIAEMCAVCERDAHIILANDAHFFLSYAPFCSWIRSMPYGHRALELASQCWEHADGDQREVLTELVHQLT
jgi:hypothetical protein